MGIRNTNLGGADWQTTGASTLDGAIDNAVTTITVVATASFKSAGTIKIDDELITYTGKTATDFTGCTRGAFDTTAASHLTAAATTEEEVTTATDLNDTFDAAYNLARQNPTFWLNSDFWTVYDDFESYSTGSLASNAKWTFTVSADNDGVHEVVASTNAGGSSQELKVDSRGDGTSSGNKTTLIETEALADNRHTHMKLAIEMGMLDDTGASKAASMKVKIGTGGDVTVWTNSFSDLNDTGLTTTQLLRVAKGSDVYDVYWGGKKIIADYDASATNGQLTITLEAENTTSVGNSYSRVYIDDVRESNVDVV